MTIRFTPIPTKTVRAYQAGGPDANGQAPEHHVSDGDGNPCRHCLPMKNFRCPLMRCRPIGTLTRLDSQLYR